MSDRVAVRNGGRVVQVGMPSEIYTRPRTEFVAAFLGETSLLTGNVVRLNASKAWIRTDAGLQVAVEQNGDVRVGRRQDSTDDTTRCLED